MSLDVNSLLNTMLAAVKDELSSLSEDQLPKVTEQLQSIAEAAAHVEAEKIAGSLSEEEARRRFKILELESKITLLRVKGVALVSAERMINSALSAIADVINGVVGFELIEIDDD